MLPLAWLTKSQREEYEHRLATGYEQRTTVTILTNEEKPVSTISAWLIDGQVNARIPDFDPGSERIEVSRDASLTFLDPERELGFDSTSPVDGAMYLDRMIRAEYGVLCSFGWVDVPVFTGPVTSIKRDGELVTVEAQGKELFGLGEANTTHTYNKGRNKVSIFMDLVLSTGELQASIDRPVDSSGLVQSFSLTHTSKRWYHAFRVLRSIGREPYYDGSGRVRTPKSSTTPVWTFAYGKQGMLLSSPTVGASIDSLKNVARVIGAVPKGAKYKVVGVAAAESSNPLAARKMGRRGVGRFLMASEEDSTLNTKSKVTSRAKRLLADNLAQQVTTQFTALPVPHLEPYDLVLVNSPHFAASSRVHRMSLPLAGGVMTVGFHDRVSRPNIPVARRAA